MLHPDQHFALCHTWISPNGQYRNETDYILCSQIWRNYTVSKTTPGADCDLELLIAKLRIKWKKTIILFRYNLSLITYDYTVKVMNRVKGLDLVDRVSEELWTEVPKIVQEAIIKAISKKKKHKKAKWPSEEALQISEMRREVKSKGERERYTRLNA